MRMKFAHPVDDTLQRILTRTFEVCEQELGLMHHHGRIMINVMDTRRPGHEYRTGFAGSLTEFGQLLYGFGPRDHIVGLEETNSIFEHVATLCHEMVHIQQKATGRMPTDLDDNDEEDWPKFHQLPAYQSSNISTTTPLHVNSLPPWEWEAYARMWIIYKRVLRDLSLGDRQLVEDSELSKENQRKINGIVPGTISLWNIFYRRGKEGS